MMICQLQEMVKHGAASSIMRTGRVYAIKRTKKKVIKVYQENCWDVISVGIAEISLAVAVYFGDWIKALVKLNLVALLLLVQAVYVGIRAYVKGCKRVRGYY